MSSRKAGRRVWTAQPISELRAREIRAWFDTDLAKRVVSEAESSPASEPEPEPEPAPSEEPEGLVLDLSALEARDDETSILTYS